MTAPDLLSPEDLHTARREWIGDVVDRHSEWGKSPVVAASASVGAATLSVSGLGSGLVTRGTPFALASGGSTFRYTVAQTTPITNGSAAIVFTPSLVYDAAKDDKITVEPYLRSIFNKRTGRELFSDIDLQDLAARSMETYAERFAQTDDPKRYLFMAITMFAIERMEQIGSDFQLALLQDDARGNARQMFDKMREKAREYRDLLDRRAYGATTISVTR